ncbi:MAG TPA: right-handed parallel beta-helix repeat-containing protein [bacterium]|nr:right-handed parallel beta-helix repeat-containing protein [bacterium]
MKRAILACVVIAASALLPIVVTAEPTITIYTDAQTYQYGDTIEVSLAALNLGSGVSVDLYVGLLTPDGGLYTLSPYGQSGWSGNLEAWIPDIYVPPGFAMDRTPFWWFDVPCSMPPIGGAGHYDFAAVLTRAGSFDEWVCNASFAPFAVRLWPASHYYVDGETGDDSNDGSESSPWKTITHALASALNTPATIHVAAGTYSASTNGERFPLRMKSWVSLTGDGPNTTTLDAEDSAYHVIFCYNANELTIEDFTITGGNANGDSSAHSSGGGIYCYESLPTIVSNTITANTAYSGGGIYCWDSSPIITNNAITDNTSEYYCGGGIFCYYYSSPAIENNAIEANAAVAYGGGIYCDCYSSPTVRNNTITDNTAEACGGGIYCYYTSPMIQNNAIEDNTAGYGAGVFWYGGSPTVRNNAILYNSAGGCGGGIYCYYSSPTIENNTILDNTANTNDGGGIYCYKSSPTIINCIMWGNSGDLYHCYATYCCIEENDPGEGNIHYDPMFVEGPFGDHYLHPDSLCIDAGSQSTEEAGLSDRTTQADSTPDTGTVDMGFHYPIP